VEIFPGVEWFILGSVLVIGFFDRGKAVRLPLGAGLAVVALAGIGHGFRTRRPKWPAGQADSLRFSGRPCSYRHSPAACRGKVAGRASRRQTQCGDRPLGPAPASFARGARFLCFAWIEIRRSDFPGGLMNLVRAPLSVFDPACPRVAIPRLDRQKKLAPPACGGEQPDDGKRNSALRAMAR